MTDFKREDYYGTGLFQPLDFWENLHMPASLATMLKYLVRAGKKDGESRAKDLQKAKNYWNTFRRNIDEHVKFSYFNTYATTMGYSHNLAMYSINEFINYLTFSNYSTNAVNCIYNILIFSLKLVKSEKEYKTYSQYLHEIVNEDIEDINTSFNKLLEEVL